MWVFRRSTPRPDRVPNRAARAGDTQTTLGAPARLLAIAALSWASVLPPAVAGAGGDHPPTFLTIAVYGIGYFICHQRPERSFQWDTVPWPVCARCLGLYVGAALSALILLLTAHPSSLSPARARLWISAAAAPAVASLVYEWTTGHVPSNLVRAATGFVLGSVASWIVIAFIDESRTKPVATPLARDH
jgi:uncharacterized membrane protein